MPIVYDPAQAPTGGAPVPADQAPTSNGIVNVQGIRVMTGPDGQVTNLAVDGPVEVPGGDGTVRVNVAGQTIAIDRGTLRDAMRDAMRHTRSSRDQRFDAGTEIRINGEPMPDGLILAGGFAAGALVCLVLGLLIGLPLVRLLTRRAARRAVRPSAEIEAMPPRLERIEQAVEAIAVEVERVAEAQRYSTRLLSERLPDITGPLPARVPLGERRMTPGGGGRVPTPH